MNFGREITSQPETSLRHEWLVTNGIGGYAMGTVSLARTRRYHGLLVAALTPPTQRYVLLASVDMWLGLSNGHRVPLIAHEWATGVILPDGYRHLEHFHLDGQIPVWTWVYGNIKLEQRVWMPQGENTTYITYHYVRGNEPITLYGKPLISHRNYHDVTRGGVKVHLNPTAGGLSILPESDLSPHDDVLAPAPFHVLTNAQNLQAEGQWWWSFNLAMEAQRGETHSREDLYQAGQFEHTLQPDETLYVVATTHDAVVPEWASSLHTEQERQSTLVIEKPLHQLAYAADQFIIQREGGHSIIAGYPWFTDWGRDTMIALPGLTLPTGRFDVAASILRTYIHYLDNGILPNRFSDMGYTPDYNTVDASLWYIVALYQYLIVNPDNALAAELFPHLRTIIQHYHAGTHYNIHVDRSDGLLKQGGDGLQLTWMDAKIEDGWVVTPRNGKAIEVNALWYNALKIMAWLADELDEPGADAYEAEAQKVKQAFLHRFWIPNRHYCYDVVDCPEGDDDSLRPNQLFAISLPFPLLDQAKSEAVIQICAAQLLGSYGLRTLAPNHPDYTGRYVGDRMMRDRAYHQGTLWGWLLGAFVTAHYKTYQDADAALDYLRPSLALLHHHGSLPEIFDGDAPHLPRGCPAHAISVAELLRSYWEITWNSP